MLCMASGHKAQGQAYLRRAAEIYESIYAFAPEVLEEKRQELRRI